MDFIDVINKSPIWLKQQYLRDKYYNDANSIHLLLSLFDSLLELESIAINDMYLQSLLKTATGVSLDKFGDELGLNRNGDEDDIYRHKLLLYRLITRQGMTIKTIKDYVSFFGYEVENYYKYRDFIGGGSGIFPEVLNIGQGGNIGQGAGVGIYNSNWINYTFVIQIKTISKEISVDYLNIGQGSNIGLGRNIGTEDYFSSYETPTLEELLFFKNILQDFVKVTTKIKLLNSNNELV